MRLYNVTQNIFVQSKCRKMEDAKTSIHSSAKSMGSSTLSLGDVLASARSRYGNPWLSILRKPRRSSGIFVYLTPDEFGLTYSFHAFSAGSDKCDGGYIGEPIVFVGKLAHRGVTEEYWRAFAQNYCPSFVKVLSGEFSTLAGVI